ncbi:hypothetical protein BDB00DRAFT_866534 [Zychaea mexicana]|uniref:uncharacterized protein n=1 Tax=Zychaea mexicana TaxID=64656 RepID=UPI0022FEFF7C|nr:uncharacterized protein BDB00DRAFT_866534 [Zychaea mexicana]KAI9499674.1 hypothetical protein BDB00DRAFT_866534 [Zychaea mexicana]
MQRLELISSSSSSSRKGDCYHSNDRDDLVRLLTYDVLGIIFSHLSFRERIRCTRVSRSWRLFLLSWPDLWHTIADRYVNLDTNLLPYLAYFSAKHVRTVRIPEFSQQSVQFFINQSLEVPCRPTTLMSVHDMLLFACDTLTDLTIHSGVGDKLLDTVLDHCPNLISFQYSHSGFYSFPHRQHQHHQETGSNGFETTGKRYAQRPDLLRLVLDIPLDEQRLLSILSSCPNLRQLQLRSSDMQFGYFDVTLRFIHSYHRQLQHLRLYGGIAAARSSSSSFPPLLSFRLNHQHHEITTQRQGLRELWLIGTDEGSSTHVLPLIHQHHTTLTSLHIQGTPLTSNAMACLASYRYPALTGLHIQLTHYSPLASDLCSLIRHAPNLTDVALSSFTATNTVSDPVLDALPSGIRHFKLLQRQSYSNNNLTSQALIHFLQRAGPSIQEFHLPNVQAVTDNVLDVLSSQQRHTYSLETLDVHGNEQITSAGIRRLIDSLGDSLKWMNLGQCPLITLDTVQYARDKLSSSAKIYT